MGPPTRRPSIVSPLGQSRPAEHPPGLDRVWRTFRFFSGLCQRVRADITTALADRVGALAHVAHMARKSAASPNSLIGDTVLRTTTRAATSVAHALAQVGGCRLLAGEAYGCSCLLLLYGWLLFHVIFVFISLIFIAPLLLLVILYPHLPHNIPPIPPCCCTHILHKP